MAKYKLVVDIMHNGVMLEVGDEIELNKESARNHYRAGDIEVSKEEQDEFALLDKADEAAKQARQAVIEGVKNEN